MKPLSVAMRPWRFRTLEALRKKPMRWFACRAIARKWLPYDRWVSNVTSSLMESLCCRVVPSKVRSGMGHCARCVETDMNWDFVGSKVIRHFSPSPPGLERTVGEVLWTC